MKPKFQITTYIIWQTNIFLNPKSAYIQQRWKYQCHEKVWDIIISGPLASGGAICYLFKLFKYLNFYDIRLLS
jgi:hypothetical protein